MKRLYGGGSGVLALDFSPDGRLLARGAYDEKVELWDVATGTRVLVFEGHRRSVYAVAFHPGGRQVASGDGEEMEKPGRLAVWDLDGKTQTLRRLTSDTVSALAWRPDGERLAAGDFNGVARVLDPAPDGEMAAFPTGPGAQHAMAWDPDGQTLLIAGDRGLKRIDAASGATLLLLEAHGGPVNGLSAAADGRFASGGRDGTVRVWSAAGAPLLTLRHDGPVDDVSMSADGTRLAAAGERTVRLWDAAGGREIDRRDFSAPANRVAFSPDGRLVAIGLGRYHGEGELLLLPL